MLSAVEAFLGFFSENRLTKHGSQVFLSLCFSWFDDLETDVRRFLGV